MPKFKKKICILIPSHFSGEMGGAEYQAKFVSNALSINMNYDVYYLCRIVAPDFVPTGYKICKVGSEIGFRSFSLIFDIFGVYNTLKKIRPNIIYQNVGCAYTGIAAIYAKKFGAKLIWHIASNNDIEPSNDLNLKRKLINFPDRLLLNYGIRNADIIAGQTKHQSALLEKHFKRKCNTFIPIGHPLPEQVIIKRYDPITVLWVGNFKRIKQPEVFIQLAKAIGMPKNVNFVMMGRPSGSAEWFANLMEDINATSNLYYLGEASQDKVNRHFTEAHILVNTSQFEGFSNTFIQAWMRNVPVVSLNVDPDGILVKERIGFHSKTFDQLLFDVSRLIEDKTLREEMGGRASCYAFENNSLEKMLQKVMALFQ